MTLLFVLGSGVHRLDSDGPVAPAPEISTLGRGGLPLAFVPNMGQTQPSVRFHAQSADGTLSFTPKEVVLALPAMVAETPPQAAEIGPDRRSETWNDREPRRHPSAPVHPRPSILRLRFLGANPSADMEGTERLPGTVNYFLGNEPSGWRTNLPTYASVVYRQLYPGIDLRYDGTNGALKGTYIVAAGADPARIRWRYAGAADIRLTDAGDLAITLGSSTTASAAESSTGNLQPATLIERAPLAWQVIDGRRIPVPIDYALLERSSPPGDQSQGSTRHAPVAGFSLGPYDRSHALIIDPTLVYSTYLGGTSVDYGTGIAVDAAGNAYIAGYTFSLDFPTSDDAHQADAPGGSCPGGNCFDMFVTKLSADGRTMLYSTYLGGTQQDLAHDIAVDSAGNMLVVGHTSSSDFPTENALQPEGHLPPSCYDCAYDAVVVRLAADGQALLYSTYFGGSGNDFARAVALDGSGNAYLAGYTDSSTDFPILNAVQPEFRGAGSHDEGGDAFVARLRPDGSALDFSTYLGGNDDDYAYGIAVTAEGQAAVTGITHSRYNFPIEKALQPTMGGCDWYPDACPDAFVAKLEASGAALVYNTYLGGAGYDGGQAITLDLEGNAYLAGVTTSNDFPTANPFQSDRKTTGTSVTGFVTKLNPAGSALVYSTYLGGLGTETATGIGVDRTGHAYVSGSTSSMDFPVAGPSQAGCPPNDYCPPNVFVTKFRENGHGLVYSTQFGGRRSDDARALTIDQDGAVYITGDTSSSDFYTDHALQPNCNASSFCRDVFVIKIAPGGEFRFTPTTTPTPSNSASATQTATTTSTPSSTAIATATATPTETATPSSTPTSTAPSSPTRTATLYREPTATTSRTATLSPTRTVHSRFFLPLVVKGP